MNTIKWQSDKQKMRGKQRLYILIASPVPMFTANILLTGRSNPAEKED